MDRFNYSLHSINLDKRHTHFGKAHERAADREIFIRSSAACTCKNRAAISRPCPRKTSNGSRRLSKHVYRVRSLPYCLPYYESKVEAC